MSHRKQPPQKKSTGKPHGNPLMERLSWLAGIIGLFVAVLAFLYSADVFPFKKSNIPLTVSDTSPVDSSLFKDPKLLNKERPESEKTPLKGEAHDSTTLSQSGKEEFSVIAGRVLDSNDDVVSKAHLRTENGEESYTNEFGAFEIKVKIRKNQQKVFLYYKKDGLGNKEQYVGVEQQNIVLKF